MQLLICDSSRERGAKVAEFLQKAKFEVLVCTSQDQFLEKLRSESPALLIFHEAMASEREVPSGIFKRIPSLVYGEEIEVTEKLNFYRRGARRVVTEKLGLEAKVAAVAGMIAFRFREFKKLRQNSLTFGSLQGTILFDILQNAYREKKNLVLHIHFQNWKAKIRTFQGHIVSAATPNLKGIEAAVKALVVSNGTFLIRHYHKIEDVSHLGCSTFGILNEAHFHRQEVDRFLDSFGMRNPRFILKPGLTPEFFDHPENEVVEAFTQYLNFQLALLKTPIPVLKTIQILKKLCENGILIWERNSSGTEGITPEDISYIYDSLFPAERKEGKLLILGLPGTGKKGILEALTTLSAAPVKKLQGVHFAKIPVSLDARLNVFSIDISKQLQTVLDKLSDGILACILLIDAAREDQFDYTKYLFQQLIQNYGVQIVVGVTHLTGSSSKSMQDIRETFQIPPGIEVLAVTQDSMENIRQLLLGFRHISEVSTRG